MSIFICWVLFPTVFCLLSLGCGLVVQWISGAPIRSVLLLPVGYATIVVASQVTTFFSATTFLATPLVVVLGVAGLAIGVRTRRPPAPGLWPAAAALGVFLIYAAPVVLSGSATFLGYTLLGDTSIHFTLIDWVMKHGFHAVPLGPPSSSHSVIANYLITSYPLGAHTALGAVRPLVGQDVAWVFQPYIALLAAFTSLSVYALLERAIPARWLLALAAFLAAQTGLVYGYALEASVKEIATVCMIPLLVAVGSDFVARRGGVRATIPLAVVTAAGLGILNASILVWFVPILLAVLIGLFAKRGLRSWRTAAIEAGAFAILAAALSYPSLWVVNKFISNTTSTFTTGANNANEQFGNLLGPLSRWHAFGIWPVGDFRLGLTNHVALAYALIGVAILAVVLGLLWALRTASWWPLVFVAVSAIGWGYVTARSTPWGDAKALVIVSPALMATSLMGAASLWRAARRPEALLVAGAIAFGVLWTNALAYHSADLAPRDRLAELGRIGARFAGQGPTLYTEFEEFNKHFLRRMDPSGSDESWQDDPRGVLVDGGPGPYGYSIDIDQLAPLYVQHFRTLVLRRSGSASRPPSNYRLEYTGRFYTVWQKAAPSSTVIQHVALGDLIQPGAPVRCEAVAKLARAGGTRLAYVDAPQLPAMLPVKSRHPSYWRQDPGNPFVLVTYGGGTATGRITVHAAGRYAVWAQGSFSRRISILVDGKPAGHVQHMLNPRWTYTFAGSVSLQPGVHTVELVRARGNLAPGDGGRDRSIGPVVFDPSGRVRTVQQVPASGWRQLCGRRLDWVESIR